MELQQLKFIVPFHMNLHRTNGGTHNLKLQLPPPPNHSLHQPLSHSQPHHSMPHHLSQPPLPLNRSPLHPNHSMPAQPLNHSMPPQPLNHSMLLHPNHSQPPLLPLNHSLHQQPHLSANNPATTTNCHKQKSSSRSMPNC